MSNEIKVVYEEIEIIYHERDDLWRFTLRGRDRSAESLAKAKEAIDKPVPDEKKKAFKRISAYRSSGYSDAIFELGQVTSIAEVGIGSRVEVWFAGPACGRRKEMIGLIFADSSENRELIAQMKALSAQREALTKQRIDLVAKMAPLQIDVPE